jgi:WS/DGAT/MGAT family acyltransferase
MEGDMSEDLSNVDAAWLHMEIPNNLMMITGVFVFDQPVDFERMKTMLEQRLLIFDRFRQRIVEGRFGAPRWEIDPQFNIANHVHRIALPAPGDAASLQALVSDLMSTPLDFSKPLWQYHLVEGYGDGSALIARLHHCIGDGIALMRVLLSMTDLTPDAQWSPPQEEPDESPRSRNPLRVIIRPATAAVGATRRITGSLVGGSVDLLTHPSHAMDLTRLGTETTMALGRLLLLPPDPKTVFKGPLQVPKRAVWSEPIPLSLIKDIGKETGSTLNDVLLSAVAGALRRYAQGRGQVVDGLNVRGVIPVNLRQEEAKIELGNKFGLVFLSLPLGIADSMVRLFELRRRMNELKDSKEAVVAFGILNAIGMAPSQIEDIVVNIFGAKATAVMTNVPGPRQTIYFAGAAVRELMFWVPQSGRLGMGVSIFSYNNQVWLGLVTDVSLVPDPDTIIRYFHAELEELHAMTRQAPEEPPVPDERAVVEPEPKPAEARPVARPSGDELSRIKGIGPTFAGRLRAAGIDTRAALAACTVEQLSEIVQAPDWRRPDYQSWIDQAR